MFLLDGPWGSCEIDKNFILLIEALFDKKNIDEFRKTNFIVWTDLMKEIESAKCQSQDKKELRLTFPPDFIEFICDQFSVKQKKFSELIQNTVNEKFGKQLEKYKNGQKTKS